MFTSLITISSLPQLPVQVHPVVGTGLIENDLILSFPGRWASPDQGMAEWYNEHRPERMRWRACYVAKPVGKGGTMANLFFVPTFERNCKLEPVGRTLNDPLAIRILLANYRAGQHLPGMRWEVWNDRDMSDLADLGVFTQWDLLGNVPAEELRALRDQGVAPRGNWDFFNLVWGQTCPSCGNQVAVNSHLFNIDSVVCENCNNRPFLATSVHRALDDVVLGDRDTLRNFSNHTIGWLAGVRARFDQVRRSASDLGGARLQGQMWEYALIAHAADPERAQQVRGLIEATGANFEMFTTGARMLRDALLGKTPFTDQHEVVTRFLVSTADIVQQRRLATG